MNEQVESTNQTTEPTPQEALAAQYDVGDESPSVSALGVPESAGGDSLPPADSPPAYKHPNYLVRMALDQGFSDEDISSMPSDQLGAMVQHGQNLIQRVTAQRQRDDAHFEATRKREQPTPATPEPEDELDIDEQVVEPSIAKALKKLHADNKALKAQLAQAEQREQFKQALTRNQQIDQAIATLGPSFEKHLGKGEGQQVKQNNPAAFQRRLKLVARINALEKAEAEMGNSFDLAGELTSMAHVMFPVDAGQEVTDVSLEQRKKDWANGTVARPTQRQPSPEPPGVKKARKSVEKALAAQSAVPSVDSEANGTATLDDFLE